MPCPRYLLPNEQPRVNVLRHWAVLLDPGLRAAGILAVLLFLWLPTGSSTLAGILQVGMLAVLGWFGWRVAEWRHDRFVVTDKRVLLVTGLLTKRVGMMPLMKVTDMTYERSWLGRRLGYGAFVMESAGQQQALHRVDYVPQPEVVSQTMFALLFGASAGAARPAERGPHPSPAVGSSGPERTPAEPAADEYPTDPDLPVVNLAEREPLTLRQLGRNDPDPPPRP